MSLADQVGDLEDDLAESTRTIRILETERSSLEDHLRDLSEQLEEATAFIDYVDTTSPELRVAYGAATKLN